MIQAIQADICLVILSCLWLFPYWGQWPVAFPDGALWPEDLALLSTMQQTLPEEEYVSGWLALALEEFNFFVSNLGQD